MAECAAGVHSAAILTLALAALPYIHFFTFHRRAVSAVVVAVHMSGQYGRVVGSGGRTCLRRRGVGRVSVRLIWAASAFLVATAHTRRRDYIRALVTLAW